MVWGARTLWCLDLADCWLLHLLCSRVLFDITFRLGRECGFGQEPFMASVCHITIPVPPQPVLRYKWCIQLPVPATPAASVRDLPPCLCRLVLSLEVLYLVVGVCVVVCTLLDLINLKHSGNAVQLDSASRTIVALAFMSLAATLASLVVTIVGVSRAIRAAQTTMQSVCTSLTGTAQLRVSTRSTGATVIPLHGVQAQEVLASPSSCLFLTETGGLAA